MKPICPPGLTSLVVILILALANPLASAVADDPKPVELQGPTWTLVEIASMDDSETSPQEGGVYTLAFQDDGSVQVQADCNRGRGSFQSEGPGQIQFGPIAVTRMLCPGDSIDGKFLQNLEYVRSYVYRDGHLFLATMMDGPILEFAPQTEAEVDGER
jgi:heat shock protein HslJ